MKPTPELNDATPANEGQGLTARVRALTAADRAVDAEIALALGWRELPPTPYKWELVYWRRSDGVTAPLPKLTGSVDAAMTLFEPWMDAKDIAAIFAAAIRDCERDQLDPREHLARYVCAAALQARGL